MGKKLKFEETTRIKHKLVDKYTKRLVDRVVNNKKPEGELVKFDK